MQLTLIPRSQPGVLLELQGNLEYIGSDAYTKEELEQELRSLTIGQFDPPTLQIGNHLLEGKLVTLKKPLIFVEKDNGLFIKRIFTEKYLFNARPEFMTCEPLSRQPDL